MRAQACLLAASLALLAGCANDSGSGSASGDDSAASVLPADVAVFAAINLDAESDQLKTARALVDRFPDGDRVVAEVLAAAEEEVDADFETDIRPALGDEVGIAVTGELNEDDADVVVLAKPEDPQKLTRLLEESEDEQPVQEKVGEWTAIAEDRASLDAFELGDGEDALADDDVFTDAMGELPEEAIAKVFVRGEPVLRALEDEFSEAGAGAFPGGEFTSAAFALEAEEDGMRLAGTAKGRAEEGAVVEPYEPELLDSVPSDALLVVSTRELGKGQIDQLRENPQLRDQIAEAERALGTTLEELAELLAGESALYLREGTPIPEITLAVEVEDEQEARRTVDDLAERAATMTGGRVQQDTEDGVDVSFVRVGPVRVSYAIFDNRLVVTTGARAISDFREEDDKLADSADFEAAREAAGMPAATSGFLYVNLEEAVTVAEGFGDAIGGIPPDVARNLEPLQSLVAYGEAAEDETTFAMFLEVDDGEQ